jgi:hypothetical protein
LPSANDVGECPMMTASPNDVWLRHVYGKHFIITTQSGVTSF